MEATVDGDTGGYVFLRWKIPRTPRWYGFVEAFAAKRSKGVPVKIKVDAYATEAFWPVL